jgi:hypothetical protein
MISANEASKFINTWLVRNNYSQVFKGSASTILTENRRESRPKANAAKYGKIPYHRLCNGNVGYEIVDLKALCIDRLEPICKKLAAIKAAKLAGLSYCSV